MPLWLVGDSMGGAVVMVALAEHPMKEVAGAVLVAPAVWGRAFMNPVERGVLWFLARTIPWYPLTGQGLGRMPSDNIPMLIRLSRDPLVIKETRVDAVKGLVDLMDEALADAPKLDRQPVLMLYGLNDQIVPEDPGAGDDIPEPVGSVLNRIVAGHGEAHGQDEHLRQQRHEVTADTLGHCHRVHVPQPVGAASGKQLGQRRRDAGG